MPNWKKVIVSGSDASLNSLNVDTSLTASGLIYPTTDTGEFSFIQSDGNGNLSLEYVNTIYESVYNGELTQILKGTPLYVSGAVGAESIVYRADAGDPNRMPVTYIAADNIDAASSGKGIILGLITGVDTTGYSPGTEIYVGVGGGWTSTRPSGSNIAQLLGIVTKEGNGGQGIVLNPGPFDTPNLESGQIFWGDNTDNVVKKPLAHILSGSSFTYSGSFSGSFEGDGSNLTGIQVASLQSNFNVTPFTSTGSITINHNLNATYPLVQVYDSSDNQIIPDTIEVIDADNVKITFATPRTGNVVIGKGGDIIDLTQILPPTTRAITGSFTAVTSSIINHNLDTENVLVSVYDSTKNYIIPDFIQILDGDNVQVGFSTPTTGYAVITNGGHIISGSIEWDNVLSKPSGIVSSSAQLSDATIPGNLTIQGTLTAQQFNTEFVSASIIYRSGSTKFGDTLDDIHSFTGSLEISGSLISDGDVLPHTTDIYNLGSPTKRWGDVYLTSASIYLNSTKLSATSDGKVSGSFTGSFFGDGSQLSGVTSYTDADTLSYINTLGVVSSSAQLSEFSGSFSGSFYGDGSNLSGVTSYTDADTLSYINSLQVLSGSVDIAKISGSNYSTFDFTNTGSITVNHNLNTLYPIVQVYDSTNSIIIPQTVQSVSTNSTKIVFGSLETGKIILSKGGDIIGSLTQQTLNAADSDILTYLNSSGVEGDILPRTTDIYNLGSPTKRWGDVYLTSASIYLNNTKLSATSDGKVSGSFTGSFVGDGSQLSGVTSYTNDDTLSYINTLGVVSSSAQLSIFSGSFSGSFIGDGSQLSGVTSYTDADTLSYINSLDVVSGSTTIPRTDFSNNFAGTQTFLNLVVNGTGSFAYINQVTGSAKVIGDNYIFLNADSPTQRYSGLKIFDSGSADTGSLEYDSVNNHWFYESTTEGYASGLMAGPRATRGAITWPSNNYILKGTGGNHLGDSIIYESGSNIGIGTTSPKTKNHIWSGVTTSSGVSTEVLRLQHAWGTVGDGPLLRFTNYHINGLIPNTLEYNLGGIAGRDFAGNWAGGLVFMTSTPGTTGGTDLQDRMVIRESGNVGIGTTSPSNKLDVIGDISSRTTSLSGGLYFGDGTNSGIYRDNNYDLTVHQANSSGNKLYLGSAGDVVVSIDTNNNGTTDSFIIQKDALKTGATTLVEVNNSGHILPGANGTQNLGSSSLRWNTVYTSDLSLKNDVGDWTIVEGEEDLFLYNNKKDKVYKFNLTEVDKDSAPKKRS